ncbi:type II secretion system F family protein [Aliikangiella sp. IMCC44653]
MTILIILLFAAAMFLFFYAQNQIRAAVPKYERIFMDPLPPMLKLLWPMIQFFAYYLGERLPVDYLEKSTRKLKLSGVSYILTAEQYFAVRIVAAICAFLMTIFCMGALGEINFRWLLGLTIFGYFLPRITLNDLHQKRKLKIIRDLPTYLDYITMSVQAGLNLSGAIQQSVDKGPAGPLHSEFEGVIRDLRAGMSRTDALRAMAERVRVKEVGNLVSALVQAEKTGASLSDTLRIQADQRRIERFQRAEKKAMEAPVKLVFPLIAFIFPVTFMVIGFPIAMKMIHGM